MIYPGQSAVGAIMQVLRWQWALIGLAIAFLLFWDPLNSWLNFERMDVKVTSVQPSCWAIRSGDHGSFKTGACESLSAEFATASDVTIERRDTISFDFVSPADGLTHQGSVVRPADGLSGSVAVGDTITIEASNRAATHVRDAAR